MNFIKKIILIYVILFSLFTYSQNNLSFSKYYLEIPNPINIPVITKNSNTVSLNFSNKILTNLFSNYSVYSFELAFPGGVGSLLEIVYIIKCDRNLMTEITNNYKPYFGRSEEIQPMQLLYMPNDFGGVNGSLSQPELSFINAPAAWDISKGDNVTLGNSEPVYSLHEELVGKITNIGVSTINAVHGTQVAIVSAGSTDNSIGISSVGFNSKLIVNGGSFSSLIPLANNGARVINMSWGSCNIQPLESQYGQAIIDQVWNMGVFVIAAAGNGAFSCPNYGPNAYHYPASLNHVFSVTSVGHLNEANDTSVGHGNRKDVLEDFNILIPPGVVFKNTFNDKVDISAPGHDIITAKGANGSIIPYEYQFNWGTSFASPMVMGVVGLMISANDCLYPNEIESILKLTAVKNDLITLNLPYTGLIGAGRVNAFEAVQMAKSMSLPFGVVEIKNRLIDRWNFVLKTSPFKISMLNVIVEKNATIDLTAKNDIEIISGDYSPISDGFVLLTINALNANCNTPPLPVVNKQSKQSLINITDCELYPNPNEGVFNVDLHLANKSELKFLIYNLLGELLFVSESNSSKFVVNAPNLKSGVYILKILYNDGEKTIKFIKK